MKKQSQYTHQLRIRITDTEAEKLNQLKEDSGANSISAVVRMLLEENEKPIRTKEEYMDIKHLIFEVNKIGVNINQITRLANENRILTEREKKMLNEMQSRLVALMEKRIDSS